MAKMPMKRIEIIALLTDGKSVVERLQRRGAVDLLQYDVPDGEAGIEKVNTVQSVTLFEKSKNSVQQALAILDQYAPLKKSLLSSFSPRKTLTTHEFGEMVVQAEKNIQAAYELISIAQKISENRAAIKNRQQSVDYLEIWRSLEVPMRFSGTSQTKAFIGTLPGSRDRETLLTALDDAMSSPSPVDVNIVYSSEEQSGIFVLCHKSNADECEQVLRELGFAQPHHITEKPPAELIEQYEQDIEQLEDKIDYLSKNISEKSSLRSQLLFTLDYLSMRCDKYRALEQLAMTQRTVVMEGYVPAEKAQALVKELEEKYTICVTLHEPDVQENVPVAFKNWLPAAALEDITSSYSMPSKTDIDPNGVMAFFYYLFFGMMLSDAGYGLLIAISTGLILHFKKPEGQAKRNLQKFLLCGLSTVFWGAMFGSWFGDVVGVVSKTFFGKEVQLSSIWFEPVENPMKLLIFSLILGFIQVMVGLGVKFYELWKDGKRWAAIFDIGLWWVIFAGILTILASNLVSTNIPLLTIGEGVAIAGAVGLILTQGRSSKNIFGKILGGLGSLYNITGYMSDILSYCRLMALGLVTGIIGSVVNSIGSMFGSSFIGFILFLIVFLLGHSINLGINLLGAYVHCNRLQYVEFFSKFYEGGGKPFTPLQVNTEHYKFKEENKYV